MLELKKQLTLSTGTLTVLMLFSKRCRWFGRDSLLEDFCAFTLLGFLLSFCNLNSANNIALIMHKFHPTAV